MRSRCSILLRGWLRCVGGDYLNDVHVGGFLEWPAKRLLPRGVVDVEKFSGGSARGGDS
ncbi:hypothetical protein KSP39_PZI020865 [Platanthera zijinensis]|uniref:Uncharacterized protein n=1 Tax=Platanthera zijinensis TaxID=2320716 RepID=A0AAP0B0J5_9ASPA